MNDFQERIGVGQRHYGLGFAPPTRERRIIADDGPRKGKLAAIETDHASGRVDAQVFVDPVKRRLSLNGAE